MFIIKVHKEATENNPNFKGEVNDYYYGKNEQLLARNFFPAPWYINEYAYKTKAAAVRGLKAMQDNCDFENEYGSWNSTCEIVQVKIPVMIGDEV